MPNHIHILIKVYDGFELGKIVKSWKSYSSRYINGIVRDAGLTTSAPRCIWQRGYWDRYIRDEEHFYKTIDYIKKNFDNGGILAYIK